MGLVVAATRVYVNEGSGYKDWFPTWALNPYDLKGSRDRGFKQSEFDILGKIRQRSQQPVDEDGSPHAEHGALPEHSRGLPAQGCHRGRGKGG